MRVSRLCVVALLLAPLAPASGADSPEAWEQARLCLTLRREEGLEECRRTLALGLSAKRAGVVLQVLAYKLAILKRWDEVAATYRDLVRLRLRDPLAHIHLGEILLHGLNRPEEAVTPLKEAVRLGPSARAHASLATALNALGRHAEAVAAFEEALRLEPDYFEHRSASREVYEAARRGEAWPPPGS